MKQSLLGSYLRDFVMYYRDGARHISMLDFECARVTYEALLVQSVAPYPSLAPLCLPQSPGPFQS